MLAPIAMNTVTAPQMKKGVTSTVWAVAIIDQTAPRIITMPTKYCQQSLG